MNLAPFIYTLQPNKAIPADYYEQGQTLATAQLILAGYRLAFILQHSGVLEPYEQKVMP